MEAAAASKDDHERGFHREVPDLRKGPGTKIVFPQGRIEVAKRLQAEKGRIEDHTKMLELYLLRDSVHRNRFDTFHWGLKRCAEYKSSSMTEIDALSDDM